MFGFFFFFQAEDGIRDVAVTGVQTCALPIYPAEHRSLPRWFYRRRRELQPVVPSSGRLQGSVEGLALLQHLATRSSGACAVQTPPAMRDDAAETRWCLVLRGQQPHPHRRERDPVL